MSLSILDALLFGIRRVLVGGVEQTPDRAGINLVGGNWTVTDNSANNIKDLRLDTSIKLPVRVATTAALPANTFAANVLTADANGALPAIDGVSLSVGDAMLVKDESSAQYNGIYTVTALGDATNPWTLTRRSDFDADAEARPGTEVLVVEGDTQPLLVFTLTTLAPITLNTTPLNFVGFKSELNVLRFGADPTGTNDSTAAVQAAVTAAFNDGADLYWPPGDYLTSSSVTNFHDVRHRGPGRVKRGSDLWRVEPQDGDTLTVYVDPAGNDSNDGLSSSEPRLTIQGAGDIFYALPFAEFTPKVQLASGTFTENVSYSKAFPTGQRIQFLGADVSDGTAPTTIIDSPGGAVIGLSFQNGARAYVEDVYFTDFSVTNASGVTASTGSDLWCKNVWCDNCDVGIEGAEETRLRVENGLIGETTGCTTGIRCISNVTFTIGYRGSATSSLGDTGPAIRNCSTGIFAQESATGHADYVHIDACGVGAEVIDKSRFHFSESPQINNCTTAGIRARVSSSYFDNPSSPLSFSGNAIDVLIGSGSVDITNDQNYESAGLFAVRDTATASTQSTSPQTVLSHQFPAGYLATRASGFVLRLSGDVVGTTSTKNVTVSLGATTLLNHTIASGTSDWVIEVELANRTASGSPVQKYYTKVFENGASPSVAVASAAEDLTVAKTLTVTHNVADAADRIDTELVTLRTIRGFG